jgi:hypothetical protein
MPSPFRLLHPSFVLLLATALTGCGSDGGAGPNTDPATLAIGVSGYPAGREPTLTVTGPNGYSHDLSGSGQLADLTPGQYTVTAHAVDDVGLAYVPSAASTPVTLDAGGHGSVTVTYALHAPLPRSTTNRSDGGATDLYRVMYVLPSDGTDRHLDTDGTITRTVSSWERWLVTQTGGAWLRLDTSDGALDITFARLDRSDATMASYGDFIRDTLEKNLRAAGYGDDHSVLLVYYDGGHQSRCGSSALPPALPGVVAAIFLKGLGGTPIACANNPFAATPTAAPGYIEFTALHEALHALGIVSTAAPDFNNYRVDNDPTDLMYAGAQPWHPSVLDITKSNYYNTNGLPSGVFNLDDSDYLVRVR